MIIDVYIGNDKLELYKDETIELNSSIANINDITKNTTEYTKSFTVPASDINNRIFKHYYNANIDNTFDARTKVNGRIELGGIPFRYGKWRLEKVSVAKGNPKDYTINFRGNLVSLKDKFKEDTIDLLDLSQYDHLSNYANVSQGLKTSLFNGDIIYNLFSKKQLYFNSNPSDNTNTDTLANIAFGGGVNSGVKFNELKPSIKIARIIEAIQTKYDITFSQDFFGRQEFQELYLWLNRDVSVQGQPTEQLITWQGLSNNRWNSTSTLNTKREYRIIVTPTINTIPYKIIVKNFGIPVAEFESSGGEFIGQLIEAPFTSQNTPFQLTWHLSCTQSISYTAKLLNRSSQRGTGLFRVDENYNSDAMNLIDTFNVSSNLPNIKVIDFLKGLFSMFKLVVIADEYDNVFVNTLTDYYASGKVIDITRFADFEKYDVERGNILNTIKFNFEDSATILNAKFKENTGIAYGDEELILEDEDGNLLDGDKLEIKLPFEQIIYERLTDLNDNVQTSIVYGAIFDNTLNPVNPKAHIFYNNNVIIGDTSKYYALRNGNTKNVINQINNPSHTLGVVSPQFSTIFSEEFGEWDGVKITNTLYKNYYKDYVDSVFNIKRRTFKYSCKNLPVRILTSLRLNDIIKIKQDYYRIDNFNFNLLSGETTFTLINSFDNTILPFRADRVIIYADYTQQTQSIFVTNLVAFDYNTVATWVTAYNVGGNVYFDIAQNTTGAPRTTTVTITDTSTLREIEVTIIQSANSITADSNIVRASSNLITADNG